MDPGALAILRQAEPADAETVAALLHAFNTEFAEPSRGPEVLAARLNRLLAGESIIALLAGNRPWALRS